MKTHEFVSVFDKFNKEYEFQRDLCNAILVQLDDNLVYDYPICDAEKLGEFIVQAVYEVCGSKKNKKCYCSYKYILFSELKYPKKISKKLLDRLGEIIYSSKNKYSFLHEFIWNERLFGHEWFCTKGDFYRYRPGEKEKAQKVVKKQFSKKELEKLEKIGKLIKQYLRKKK